MNFRFYLVFAALFVTSQAVAQTEAFQASGETIERTFSIVEQKIGSRSADIRDREVSISVPSGYSVVNVKINTVSCHYCGIRLDGITQPDELSFENETMLSIRESSKSGFLSGAFSFGSDSGSANAAQKYAKFSRYIGTNLKFFAATNGQVKFRYSLDSDSYNHGAWIKSEAIVTLQKVPTESDAKLVLDVIRAAAEFQEKTDLQELIAATLDFQPFEPQASPNVEAAPESETSPPTETSSD